MQRVWRGPLLLAILATVAALGAMTFLERLIFQPGLGGPPPGFGAAQPSAEFGAEDVFLETDDGVRIHAFWLEAEAGVDRAILFLHGNAGDASRRLSGAARLRDLGAHVLLLDYRGYGRSEGRPSEKGTYADARAGLDHLRKARRIPLPRTIVFGRSLGGAVAVHTAQGVPLAGLVVESTFPSVADVARSYLGIGFDFWLGSKFASIDKVKAIRCPVLAIHGDRDRVIRISLGRRLFAAMPGAKTWHEVAGGRHNDTPHVGGERYWDAWREFLARVVPLAGGRR